MKCFFINLATATTRRQSLEANFARHATEGWSLERFPAIGTDVVRARKLEGRLRSSEIACALSHLELMRQKREEREPFLILEDDALFGPNSCQTMRQSVDHLMQRDEWDILFPDLCIAQIGVMAELLVLRRQLLAKGQSRLLNPRGLAFSSATSYILHPRAIPKILSATPKDEWNVPYDLLLRSLVQKGQLRAFTSSPLPCLWKKHPILRPLRRAMKHEPASFGICSAAWFGGMGISSSISQTRKWCRKILIRKLGPMRDFGPLWPIRVSSQNRKTADTAACFFDRGCA